MREARIGVSDAAFDAMGIGPLVSLCREAGLRTVEELSCRGTGATLQVTVEEPIETDRLAELECVDRWERVSGADGAHVYVLKFTAPGLPDRLADRADELVGTCDPDVDERGATVSLVGSQESITGAIRDYESAGASPDLRKFSAYDGGEAPLDDLTDRQREVIRTAFDAGYYEVPREASAADVAAELEVDPSTVTEHLQRAERNLLTRHLEASQ